MKRTTRKHLEEVARLEIREWNNKLPRGLVIAILFAFIHRFTTGETVEETFFRKPEASALDYQI